MRTRNMPCAITLALAIGTLGLSDAGAQGFSYPGGEPGPDMWEDAEYQVLIQALITAHGIESVSSLTLSTRLCRLLCSHTRSWNGSVRTNPRPVVFYESWPTP